MRKFLSLSLLATYLFGLAAPFLPLAEYALFHEYIAAYLCEKREIPRNDCHGQCHLNQRISEAVGAEEEKSPTPPASLDRFLEAHLPFQTSYFAAVPIPQASIADYAEKPSGNPDEPPTPPPKGLAAAA